MRGGGLALLILWAIFVLYHELIQLTNAAEKSLLLGLTLYWVGESAELAQESAYRSLEYSQGRKTDLGGWVRCQRGSRSSSLCVVSSLVKQQGKSSCVRCLS